MTDTIACPFRMCGAYPRVGGDPALILQHRMAAGGAIGGQPCPASLMPYPLTDHARELLAERLEQMKAALREERDKLAPPPERAPEQGYVATPRGLKHRACNQFHGPSEICPLLFMGGRPGREPGENDPSWQRGGREDEDVLLAEPQQKQPVPTGVTGETMGGTMTDVNLPGTINGWKTKGEDVVSTLDRQIVELDTILIGISAVLENINSDTLREYYGSIANAKEKIENAKTAIKHGGECGERYVNILNS